MNAGRVGNRIAIAAVALLAMAHLAIWFVSFFTSPIGFDEAFILQAPLNLVQGRGYSTEDWVAGGPNIPFDATVSTGPIVGMPVALSFLIFGVSIEAARIVTLPFFLLLLACLVVLGRRYAGWWGAAAALGILIVLDARADFPYSVLYGPSDALGEYPTAALLALALVLLPRRRMLAGLLVGFAVLGKFMSMIAVPAFLLALLLIPITRGRPWGRRVGELLGFLGFAALPNVVWELVKLVSLGWTDYLVSLRAYAVFVFHSGSGADATNKGDYLERGSQLFAAWQFPTPLALVLGVALIALGLVGVWRRAVDQGFVPVARDRFVRRAADFLRSAGPDVLALALALGAVAVWWTFISSSVYIRHTMPIMIATVPVVAALAVAALRWLVTRGRAWRATASAAVVVATAATAYGGVASIVASTQSPLWSRADQQATADFVQELGVEEVQGMGWWEAPDIRLLSGIPSRPVGTGSGSGPLILEPVMRVHNPYGYQYGSGLCRDILFERNGFVVCEIDSDQAPLPEGTV